MFSIHYASLIGIIKVNGTNDCISAIEFISEKESDSNLSSNSLLQECVRQLDEYFKGKRKVFDLPVKQVGTPFQQSVWKELLQIPFGQTVSYLHIAKKLGREEYVRAVGAANGQNKIPIIIPCHRVIGSNGKLVGFAYGLERKKYLLDLEKSTRQLKFI